MVCAILLAHRRGAWRVTVGKAKWRADTGRLQLTIVWEEDKDDLGIFSEESLGSSACCLQGLAWEVGRSIVCDDWGQSLWTRIGDAF